ncbi:MAG TPA: HEAT repeat domain-containing protein [Longimicrobiales bacterium]|nr:HEAT repeat domain-containing protein [Longimicrobiales bacterium]
MLDLVVSDAVGDLGAEGYDAGIQLGEVIDRDMSAVPVTGDIRMTVLGSPEYFAWHPMPRNPGPRSVLRAVPGYCLFYPQGRTCGLLAQCGGRARQLGSPEAAPVLTAALSDREPLVRGHATWAPGEIASPESLAALEPVGHGVRPFVLEEVDGALARLR